MRTLPNPLRVLQRIMSKKRATKRVVDERCANKPSGTLEPLVWRCACRGACGEATISWFTLQELVNVGGEEMLTELLRCLSTREYSRSTKVRVHARLVDDASGLGVCKCSDGTRYALNCRERSITVEYAGKLVRLEITDA